MSVLVGDRRSARALDIANVIVAVVVWLLVIAGSDPTVNVNDPFAGQVVTAQDARSYYGLNLADLYAGRTDWNTIGAYPYSPAFAHARLPAQPAAVAAVRRGLDGAPASARCSVLTGPRAVPVRAWWSAAMEIAGGNISLLLAVAIVCGFRWPWTWAFVLLTKITPGIGLLWFALRREWRQLAIALGATAAVVAVSFVLTPGNWFATGSTCWSRTPARAARGRRSRSRSSSALPIGVLLIAWGAPRNQRWVVPVGGDARAAGAVVRLAVDAAGRHPAHDARGAAPRAGRGSWRVVRRGRPAPRAGPERRRSAQATTAPRASANGARFADVKPATLIRPRPTT